MAYFDEDGNEVKGLLTEEEVKAQMETENKEAVEAAATAKANAEVKEKEVETLQAQIKEAEDAKAAAAAGGTPPAEDDKDKNLSSLRKKLEETEAAQKAEGEATATRIAALEGDKVAQAIAAVAAGNQEMAEKIKHNYDTVLSGVAATTAEEISAKVQNAVKLSQGATAPNPLDTALPGSAVPGDKKPVAGNKTEFNANETSVGGKMGISDADREKYGSDPRFTNMNTK